MGIKLSFSYMARSNMWWQLRRTMSLDKAIWTGTWNIQGWLQTSWFCLNPMRCLCWGCQWDLEMGETWCWDCWAEPDSCSDSTCVQSCACVTSLSLDIMVGNIWLYLKPRWTFFQVTTWIYHLSQGNKQNKPHSLYSCPLQLSLEAKAVYKAKHFFSKCS